MINIVRFVGTLSEEQAEKLKNALGRRESNNNYYAENQFGFIGKYQFGALLLIDLGYVHSQFRSNRDLNSRQAWTGKNGVYSKDDWKRNAIAQEFAMDEALRLYWRRLVNLNIIESGTEPAVTAGYLAITHLLGIGTSNRPGARQFRQGIIGSDANGTTAVNYYNLGHNSITGANTQYDASTDRNNIYGPNRGLGASEAEYATVPASFPAHQSSYSCEADTNRLIRSSNTEKTIVSEKEANRARSIPIALSIEKWDEPQSTYNPRYPYNYVFQTRGGVIQEFDSTPGSIRYHLYHPSGSFQEIDNNGTIVNRIRGDNYEIIDRNGYVYIRGGHNITIDGTAKIIVNGDCALQVVGNIDAVVRNDVNMNVSGSMLFNVKEDFIVKADKIHLESKDYTNITDEHKEQSKNTHVNNIGKYNIKSNIIDAQSPSIIMSGSNIGLISSKIELNSSDLYVLGEGEIYAHSSKIAYDAEEGHPHFNVQINDTSGTISSSLSLPNYFKLGLVEPNERLLANNPELPELVVHTQQDIIATENEEEGHYGIRSSVPLWPEYNDPTPYTNAIAITATNFVTDIQSVNSQEFIGTRNINENIILSKYYTLGKLSTQAAVTRYKVEPQNGLSEGEIVENLKYLAINVLDKIADKYGADNIIVTSAFRKENNSNVRKQHPRGQAVDIQFRDIPKTKYHERAIEIASLVPFDQMILEFQTGGTGNPWIHISFSKQGNRYQQMTFLNHRKVSDGFVDYYTPIYERERTKTIINNMAGQPSTTLDSIPKSANVIKATTISIPSSNIISSNSSVIVAQNYMERYRNVAKQNIMLATGSSFSQNVFSKIERLTANFENNFSNNIKQINQGIEQLTVDRFIEVIDKGTSNAITQMMTTISQIKKETEIKIREQMDKLIPIVGEIQQITDKAQEEINVVISSINSNISNIEKTVFNELNSIAEQIENTKDNISERIRTQLGNN